MLIHAAILFGLDAELYGRIFRTDPAQVRQSLAPAISGGTWHEIGRALASALADALGLDHESRSAPQLPGRYVEVYRQPRWAPLFEPQTAEPGD